MNSRLHHIQNWPELAGRAEWSAALLAKQCKVSARTLERFFHEMMGVCPRVWLFEQRQRQALELLRDGSSVKETAIMLGYKSPTHFSRDFKKQFGHSPNSQASSYGV
jgi:AraC-like DNA-binding protein